jgi:HD-GYP domain-containing protein (c-di-GMP phosphodiesterase class II)
MLEIVSTHDLKMGMFVAELDRPWLGTPFALQGFLITNDRQLNALQEYCSFVSIDRSKSTYKEFAPAIVPRSRLAGPTTAKVPAQAEAQAPAVLAVLRRILTRGEQGPTCADENAPVRPPAIATARCESLSMRYAPNASVARAAVRPGDAAEETQPRAVVPICDLPRGSMQHVGLRNPGVGRRTGTATPSSELIGVLTRADRPRGALSGNVIYEDTSSVEDELLAVDEAFERTQELVRDMTTGLARNRDPEVHRITDALNGLLQSIVRNPDALVWLSRLKRTDDYSYDHALDVSLHMMAFGRHLGLPMDTLNILGTAGLLQDVGKATVPVGLLAKTDALTPAERVVLRRHVEFSGQILAGQPGFPPEALEIVMRHHERADGSGYPARLSGAQIGVFGEMAGLVDSYCAMTYDRPYRPALDNQRVLQRFYAARGKTFSEALIIEFIQCVGLFPVGTLVELNSGEVAVVIAQNRVRRLQPRVLILLDRDKAPIPDPNTLDLTTEPMLDAETPYRIKHALPVGSYGIDSREFYL